MTIKETKENLIYFNFFTNLENNSQRKVIIIQPIKMFDSPLRNCQREFLKDYNSTIFQKFSHSFSLSKTKNHLKIKKYIYIIVIIGTKVFEIIW